jgi:peptide/nickel transport system substrate-binding protein
VNPAAPTSTPKPIRVGQGPGPIAYGAGAAWVVNTIDGTLQRIDGTRFAVSAPVPVGAAPTAVLVAAGSVWVTDEGSKSVVRLDPASLRITDRIAVGNDPVALAFGGGAVWVANAADGTVTRIDLRHDDGARTVQVEGRPVGVAYAGGSAWVAITRPDRVGRIDAATLAVHDTAVASPPQAIIAWHDRPWITSLASPASHRGGTLRVVFGGPQSPLVTSLHPYDPGAAPYQPHFALLHMTNDGLIGLRRVGGAGGEQLVPDLAVSLPAVSDDGRTYTFRLRRGIRYSNGEPVRPSDFRFAILRQFLDPVSYGTSFFGDIVGAVECTRSPHDCPRALSAGIQPDDEGGTVTIHLVRADPSFLYELATTFADLLPPDTQSIESGRPVAATGPYMIAKYGERGLTLVRNPRFRQWSADAQPAGYPDVIRWTYIPRPAAQLSQVETNRADVMLDEAPAGRSGELRTTYAALAHPYVTLATYYIAFNTTVAPFSSLAARRAVNFAVDRRRISAIMGSTRPPPTCQVLPPTMFGHAPYCPYTLYPNSKSGAWRAPDPARALALVRSSGTRGERVELWSCSCVGAPAREAQYVAGMLTRLGYRVADHSTNDFQTYSQGTSDPRRPVVVIEGWIADYPYPSTFFDPLLTCTTQTEPATPFCDPRLDATIAAAKRATGAAARSLWQRADREVVDQAAWAPLTNAIGIDVVSRRVGDYQHNPQTGILLDQLWVR